LGGGLFFTAGSIRPARGLEDLLLAMKHLSLQGEKSVRLIVAGESGHRMADYQKKLKDWAQKNNLSDRICWTGSLNKNEMAWCYSHCAAFVMTSRVESFGMIAGEAMAHGCMCISSDNPCLPEIFASSALYYPPKDFTTLAKQIQAVISMGQAEKAAMSRSAKDIASRFSWEICAQKTAAELARAVRNSKLNGRNAHE